MFELIQLIETSVRTVHKDFNDWFQAIPNSAAWYIVSDYSLGNPNKQNDAFAFAILLNHDTVANISKYISEVAPRDLKSSRSPSAGLTSYLTCPVSFSLNFVVERQSQYLRDYILEEETRVFLADARELSMHWSKNVPANSAYWKAVEGRLEQMELEMRRRSRPQSLIRRIMLTAVFGATTLMLIHRQKLPQAIRWISDRDAIFDRHDGLAFDLAFILFTLMRSQEDLQQQSDHPMITFGLPGMDGEHMYDELIRLPDYLAGTLADIKLPQMMFSHRKFPPVFNSVFVNSPNNAVIELLGEGKRITSRRIAFRSRGR